MVIPGLAFASGGGGTGGAGSGPGSPGSSQNPPVPVTAGNVPVSASSDGITITSEASAFIRGGVSVAGSVPASDAGDVVEIDQLSSAASATWVPVADAGAQPGGSFAASWHPPRAGQLTIRAVIKGSEASSAAAAPTLSLTVYRRSTATLYGPGFWGHRTACGEVLRRRTIGVANRTLPCGTLVQLYYKRQRDHGARDRPRALRPRGQLGPDDGHRARDRRAHHGRDRRCSGPVRDDEQHLRGVIRRSVRAVTRVSSRAWDRAWAARCHPHRARR